MKKILIICVMALTLFGCSSKSGDLYKKYEKAITSFENGNLEEGINYVKEVMPQPETETITLTKDNVNDYFDLVFEFSFKKNAEGKYVNLWDGQWSIKHKEGINVVDCKASLGIEMEPKWHKLILKSDTETTGEAEIGELVSEEYVNSSLLNISDYAIKKVSETIEINKKIESPKKVCRCVCNGYTDGDGELSINGVLVSDEKYTSNYIAYGEPKIVNASGTITIAK